MNKKKAMIYPYDLSNIHLVIYEELLPNIEITSVVSPSGWGYQSEDVGEKLGMTLNIQVKSDVIVEMKEVDVMIISDSILSLPEEHICDIIFQALNINKEVIVLRKLQDDTLKKLASYGEKIKVHAVESKHGIDLEHIPQNYKMKDVSKPVVLVLGTGERCDKFTVQLELRKIFLDEGFRITQIGSKKESGVYNFHSFPQFMMEDGRSVANKIINFNRYINYLCSYEKSDLVILGVPGGIYPYDEIFHNDFGILNFMVSNAINPDFTVISSLNVDYKEDFANEIKKSLQHKYEYDVDCIFMSNTAINWMETKSINELSYLTISQSYLMKMLDGKEFFSIYNKRSREKFKNKVLGTLNKYADIQAL